jgi:hypothetical protein
MTKLYVIEYCPPKGDPVPCTMHEYTTNPSEYKIATYQRVEK